MYQGIKQFWYNAKQTHSVDPYEPGWKKHRQKAMILCPGKKIKKIRRYKGEGGVIKITAEFEI